MMETVQTCVHFSALVWIRRLINHEHIFSHVKSMHDMSDQMYGMCLLMKATHSGTAGQGSDTYNNIIDICIYQDSNNSQPIWAYVLS